MTALGTLRPGAANTTGLPTAGRSLIGNPGGSTALSDDSDATFDGQNTNSSGEYEYGRELADMPSDFGNMNTLSIQLRRAWQSAPSNSTWDALHARVMASDGTTVLAAGSSGGLWQAVDASTITATTPTNSSVVAFSYVNTGATKTQWDGAIVQVRWFRTRSKGGDNLGCRVYEAFITGDYTIATPPANITQGSFWIRDHANANNTLNSATFGTTQDTDATLDVERRFRIRFRLDSGTGSAVNQAYKLQYRINAGSWTDVHVNAPGDAEGTRTAVNLVEIADNSGYADGDLTNTALLGGSGTYTSGRGKDTSITTVSINLAASQRTELEYSLWLHKYATAGGGVPARLNDGDTVDFRIVTSAGAVLTGGYGTADTNIPRITVNWPVGLIGGTYPENPHRIGPHKDANGNIYTFVEPGEPDSQMLAMKSADGGDTWFDIDSANNPTINDMEGLSIVQKAGLLDILHHPGGSVRFHTFRTSDHGTNPDTWGTVDTAIVTGITQRDQACALISVGSDDYQAFFTYDGTTPFKVGLRRRISGTWDTSTTDIWNVSGIDFTSVTAVANPGGNGAYVFAHDDTNGRLYGKHVYDDGGGLTIEDLFGAASSASVVGSLVATTDNGSVSYEMNHTPPIFYSTNKVLIGWKDHTSGNLVTVVITVGSGGSVGSVGGAVNDADAVAQNNFGSRMPVADIVRDPADGKFYAFFARESTDGGDSTMWRDESSNEGSIWGTNVDMASSTFGLSPRSRINMIRGHIFTHSGGNGGKKVVGIVYDDANAYEMDEAAPTNVDAGGWTTGSVWYTEFELPAGATVVNPAVIAAVAAVPTPTVLAAANVSPAAVAAVAALPQPTVTVAPTVTPAAVAAVAALPQPTILAASLVTPTVIAAVTALPQPTVLAAATVTPAAVNLIVDLPTPTIDVSSPPVVVNPAVIAALTALPQPTILAAANVSPAVIAALTALPQPTASAGALVTPTVIAALTALPQPTILAASTVTPATITTLVAMPQPQPSAGALVTPTVIATIADLPTPTVVVGAGTDVFPATIAAVAALPGPTAQGAATMTPSTITAAVDLPFPTASAGALVSPTTISALVGLTAPALLAGANVTPTAVAVIVNLPGPQPSGAATMTPATITVVSALPTPTINVSTGPVTVTPSSIAAVTALPTPGLVYGNTVFPATIAGLVTLPTPTVFNGVIVIYARNPVQFFRHQTDFRLTLVPLGRGARRGWTADKVWDAVSGIVVINTREETTVMAAVDSAYQANKTAPAATLAAAINAALQSLGYRGPGGLDL